MATTLDLSGIDFLQEPANPIFAEVEKSFSRSNSDDFDSSATDTTESCAGSPSPTSSVTASPSPEWTFDMASPSCSFDSLLLPTADGGSSSGPRTAATAARRSPSTDSGDTMMGEEDADGSGDDGSRARKRRKKETRDVRMRKNREAAARSRVKAKAKTAALEATVAELRNQLAAQASMASVNERLREKTKECEALRLANDTLKMQVRFLQRLVGQPAAGGAAGAAQAQRAAAVAEVPAVPAVPTAAVIPQAANASVPQARRVQRQAVGGGGIGVQQMVLMTTCLAAIIVPFTGHEPSAGAAKQASVGALFYSFDAGQSFLLLIAVLLVSACGLLAWAAIALSKQRAAMPNASVPALVQTVAGNVAGNLGAPLAGSLLPLR